MGTHAIVTPCTRSQKSQGAGRGPFPDRQHRVSREVDKVGGHRGGLQCAGLGNQTCFWLEGTAARSSPSGCQELAMACSPVLGSSQTAVVTSVLSSLCSTWRPLLVFEVLHARDSPSRPGWTGRGACGRSWCRRSESSCASGPQRHPTNANPLRRSSACPAVPCCLLWGPVSLCRLRTRLGFPASGAPACMVCLLLSRSACPLQRRPPLTRPSLTPRTSLRLERTL